MALAPYFPIPSNLYEHYWTATNTIEESKEGMLELDRKFNLAGADGMRAMACLAVMFFHFTERLQMNIQFPFVQKFLRLFLLGNVGVSIFFVLSGLLLSYPFWSHYLHNEPFPDLNAYFLRRAARIIPGYYLSLLFSTALLVIFHIPSEHTWLRLITGMTFTSCFHYVTLFPSKPNGTLWTISFEVFCYFLMPLFMSGLFFITKNKARSFMKAIVYWGGVFVFILIMNQLIHIFLTPDTVGRGWQYGEIGGAKYWMPNYNPVGFFAHFSIGVFAAGFTAKLKQNAERFKRFKQLGGFDILCLLSLIITTALLWKMRYQREFSWSLQHQPYFFPYLATLIGSTLTFAPHTRWFGRIFDNGFSRFTAKMSFGLYLWHYVVINIVFSPGFGLHMEHGIPDIQTWLTVSASIAAVSYLIAALSYYLVEKPAVNWAQRLLKKQSAIPSTLKPDSKSELLPYRQ